MKKFEECKSEWLKFEREEKILITEIKKKIEIVLKQQKEIGSYFPFPRYKTIDTIKTHRWVFHRIESKTILECPCCNSDKISDSYIQIGGESYTVYECSSCDYFSLSIKSLGVNNDYHFYSVSISSYRKFNSQLDKHLNNQI